MKDNTLRGLFVVELRDLYDAESRLVKALPKMAKAASSEKLRSGFEDHLEQTKEHVDRLKQALTSLGEKATPKKCAGMTGIIEEGDEMLGEGLERAVMDAALISAAQRVEHYEIAAYGCVHAWAQVLGEDNVAELLEKTLEEEKETDEKLTELAEQINAQANSGSEGEVNDSNLKDTSDKVSSLPAHKMRSRSAKA
jgi:ferritin-like metal-binding protein YciE